MAGRIPQYFIDDLVARTDIVDVVSSVVKLKKSGRNWHGLCPFHNEKTPSFTVSQDKQFYHCFGCGEHGNAIGFLMSHDQLSYIEAIEELAKQQGLDIPREENERAQQQRQALQDATRLLSSATRFYQTQLHTNPLQGIAQAYLEKRGLSAETIERFSIGYAPDAWDNLKKHLTAEGCTEKEQIEMGLLVQKEETGRTYDRFRHRIMFPIKDWRGRVIGFGGRVLGDEKPKYLNSPETPVFHKGKELYGLYEARTASGSLERLMVVEGYMDVVALAQAGITYSVATLGTSATPEHMERLFKVVPEVIFCFDGDNAGLKAAQRALENVLPFMIDGRQARFLFLPEGEDPDSLVQKEGKVKFEQRVLRASPLSEYLFWHLKQNLDLEHPEAKAQLKQRAIPMMQQLPKGLLQTLLIQKLAETVGVAIDQLQVALEESPAPQVRARPELEQSSTYEPVASNSNTANSPSISTAGQDYYSEPIAQRLLTWLVLQPCIFSKLPDEQQAQLEQLANDNLHNLSGQMLKKVTDYLKLLPSAPTDAILVRWFGTAEGEYLQQLSREELLISADTLVKEFIAWLQSLEQKRQQHRRTTRIDALMNQIRSGQSLTVTEKEELVMLLQEQKPASS
ncbi:DNA primase [Oceanospirillum multiglobuliferum]|uniref:DNA primase n=1 Tax=Oceanospirillum multiglobuliferum TaxID=64969 RepID=A0A1T4Q3T9_9GAMM|nr:DNA primase [Oceanospirillum multiglobuliferum]OPX55497.1 DNA primase [Oceanospirillum multiglobuliferum]SJZ98181.1 DNA primase [Oceanospirillum multiglobuliferum]